MRHTANSILKIHDLVIGALLTIVLLTVGSVSAFARKRRLLRPPRWALAHNWVRTLRYA